MSEWDHGGQSFDINKYVGFIYVIINAHTNRKYIGQKSFWKKIRRKPLKGTKRVRLDKVESDWKAYYGSSERLKSDVTALGKHKFIRKILLLCKSKAIMNYEETRLQFEAGVLLSNSYYNNMINCRISGNQLSDKDKQELLG